ncbi:MAG: glycosyltransferase [Terriglobales bacterium]
MRILVLATNLPVPAISGQAIRTLSLVRALSALGHQLTFVAPAPAKLPGNLEPLSSCCHTLDLLPHRKTPANLSHGGGLAQRLACLLTGRSYSCQRFQSPPMRAKIARHLARQRFDLVWCDSLYALVNLPPTAVPIALNSHNAEHLIPRRFAQVDPNPARRWYARAEACALLRAERRACGRAALLLACSENDRVVLQQLQPDVPSFLAPNVVDAPASCDLAGVEPPGNPAVLLFQGAMDWYPNRDAADYFAARILPLIRAAGAQVRFVVAGRNPPWSLVKRWRHLADVEFTGTVPDMRPFLAAASLVVVPLRIGGGTRIKILEACAAGKAVVSTSLGAEGLDLRDGQEIVLADEPADFARHVIALLRNPMRRRNLAAAARTVVQQHYSLEALQPRLAAALAPFEESIPTLGPVPAVATCR